MPPKRKVNKNSPARETRKQPTQAIDENHGLLSTLQRLITQGGEIEERDRAYYLKEFKKAWSSLYDGTSNPNIVEVQVRNIKKGELMVCMLKFSFEYNQMT